MPRDLRFQLSDDDVPTLGQTQSLNDECTDTYGATTNRNADHHTIVDMHLRTVRFVIVVVLALVAAFSYALLTSNQVVVAKLASPELLEDKVSLYNVILGTTMFAASKVFEIYTETLIFPTLHTYLHNCSLYPGDVPQRVASKVKTNCIFWGLKTVIILMNVGFASLFVSQRERGGGFAVAGVGNRLQELDAASRRLDAMHHDVFNSFLSPAYHFFSLDTAACGTQSVDWLSADLDYTSASFGFDRHPESEAIIRDFGDLPPVRSVSLRVEACVRDPDVCSHSLQAANVSERDVISLLSPGLAKKVLHVPNIHNMSSLAASISTITSAYGSISNATLRVEQMAIQDGGSFLAVTVEMERVIDASSVRCGQYHCVAAVDTQPQETVSLAKQKTGYAVKATTRRVEAVAGGVAREVLSVSVGNLHPAFDVEAAIPETEIPLIMLQRVILPVAAQRKTWLPVEGSSINQASTNCSPLVDAYVSHLQKNSLSLSSLRISSTMLTAAMLYLAPHKLTPVKTNTLATERRLADDAPGSRQTVKLRLSIPRSSAIATFAGCGAMVLLSLLVIWWPTARVRLSPDATPAAQYVQILTDDLYPDIVHKKRLRFNNGDTLPFNEYVVDSIVLQAKRDAAKKIFLSA